MSFFNILFFKYKYIIKYQIIYIILLYWGLGIGDWGLGIGDWAQSPIPNNINLKVKYLRNKIIFKK